MALTGSKGRERSPASGIIFGTAPPSLTLDCIGEGWPRTFTYYLIKNAISGSCHPSDRLKYIENGHFIIVFISRGGRKASNSVNSYGEIDRIKWRGRVFLSCSSGDLTSDARIHAFANATSSTTTPCSFRATASSLRPHRPIAYRQVSKLERHSNNWLLGRSSLI